jgi:TetR/AcrR family transcriptional repressor of nem operon
VSKALKTRKYIIETVAPIFNKKGYAATSMFDITNATGLTKGAIYGNFDNKEAIAMAAFEKNVNELLKKVMLHQNQSDSPLQKLFLITDFYKNYDDYNKSHGGCPILNIGVDANNQNFTLLERVQYIIHKTQKSIAKLVERGKEKGEIKLSVDSDKFSKLLYTKIQGAVFMSQTMQDKSYLIEVTNEIDSIINSELKK